MRRAWWIVLLQLVLVSLAAPAWAATTPDAVKALSSAGTQVGQTITGADGQPYRDAYGNPLTVLASQTDPGQATLMSLSTMLKVPMGDLLAYTGNLGMSLPLMMTGTMTTVQRSDGGIEHVFAYAGPSGDTFVFLADQTGPNVYGVRIADVHPSGLGMVMTAHGLNGNFNSPPWYLTDAAKANYWINTQLAQITTPPNLPVDPTPAPVAGNPHGGHSAEATSFGTGQLSYVSDLSVGTSKVHLSGSKRLQVTHARQR